MECLIIDFTSSLRLVLACDTITLVRKQQQQQQQEHIDRFHVLKSGFSKNGTLFNVWNFFICKCKKRSAL